MKRIFLCSRFSKVRKLFEVKAGVLTGKKAAHICTAAKGEWFGFLSDFGKTAIKRTGLDVRRLDVSAASYHKIKEGRLLLLPALLSQKPGIQSVCLQDAPAGIRWRKQSLPDWAYLRIQTEKAHS